MIAFDPTADNRAAILSEATDFENRDWSLTIVNLDRPELIDTVIIQSDSLPVLYDLGFTDDGRYVYHTEAQVLMVYDTDTGESVSTSINRSDSSSEIWITSVAETPETGIFVASTWKGTLAVFDMSQPMFEQQIGAFNLDPLRIYSIERLEGDTYIVHASDGIYTFDSDTETLTMLDLWDEERVAGFELSPDHQVFAIGGENRWLLYDLSSETALLDIVDVEINSDWNPLVFAFAFKSDSTQIATLQVDGAITIYDTATGEVITTVGDFESAVSYKWG